MAAASLQQRLRLAAVIVISAAASCLADNGWVAARGTWFDVGPDMSKANCHYSWAPTGRNVAAWPDQQYGFDSSCGKCYEVRCRNANIQDGYGNSLSRSDACYDESRSVVVTIVDACPCKYPNNAYSNQRWCCGDVNHLDLSQEAFLQLADLGKGVIGLSYREVDCSTHGTVGNGNSGSSSANAKNGGNSGGSSNAGGSKASSSQPKAQQQSSSGWGNWLSGWGL